MSQFLVQLDDLNASHSLITHRVIADDKEKAGKEALRLQALLDCGDAHLQRTDEDGGCSICGLTAEAYKIANVYEEGLTDAEYDAIWAEYEQNIDEDEREDWAEYADQYRTYHEGPMTEEGLRDHLNGWGC